MQAHKKSLTTRLWETLQTKRLRPLMPFLLLLAIVCASFLVNFYMLNQNEAPPGADYGNYLIQTDILNGNDLRGYGIRHTPVFFVFLDGLLSFLGDFTALKVAAALVFSIIAIPFFLLVKKLTERNAIATVSTTILLFFISYTEMISWGGNPNFLGFTFMLTTFFFVIDLMKKPSKKSLLLSGVFLSLVVGTHLIVAVYTVFSLLIFTVLHSVFIGEWKKKFKNLSLLILVGLLFSLPYVTYYLSFFGNSSDVIAPRFLDFQLAFSSLTDIWGYLPFFAIAALTIAGLFGLSTYMKDDKSNGLLVLSLLVAPLILLLFTAEPVRWLYFLPIPVLICFGVFFKYVFKEIRGSKRTITVLTLLFIATIGVYSSFYALDHYTHAINSYQLIGEEEVQALNWIKENTSPTAIFATSGNSKNIGGGGNSYAWWVEGYADRICMYTGELELYSYQYEVEEVNQTNRIFDGTYLAEYGNMRVTEGFPGDTTHPKISAYIDRDKYKDMLILNDNQHQLFFSPRNDEKNMSIGSFYSDNKTVTVAEDNSSVTVNYSQPSFELSRTLIFNNTTSPVSVDVIYEITPVNSTFRKFELNLWSLFSTGIGNCNVDQANNICMSIGEKQNSKTVKINLLDTNGKVTDAEVFFENPETSKPVAKYQIEPLEENLTVKINVSLDTSSSRADADIHFFNSYDLVGNLNLDYVLLDKGWSSQYYRFLSDNQHYRPVYENSKVVIFRVSNS